MYIWGILLNDIYSSKKKLEMRHVFGQRAGALGRVTSYSGTRRLQLAAVALDRFMAMLYSVQNSGDKTVSYLISFG